MPTTCDPFKVFICPKQDLGENCHQDIMMPGQMSPIITLSVVFELILKVCDRSLGCSWSNLQVVIWYCGSCLTNLGLSLKYLYGWVAGKNENKAISVTVETKQQQYIIYQCFFKHPALHYSKENKEKDCY